MHAFLALVLLSIILSLNVFSFDYDIDSEGDVLEEWSSTIPKARTDSRFVIVLNSFPDRSIELYWEDPNSDEEFKMFDVIANGTANLNTFNGHRFYAKEEGKKERLPDAINIRQNIQFYSIGPEETKSYRFSVSDGITPQFGKHRYLEDEQLMVKAAAEVATTAAAVGTSGTGLGKGSPLRIMHQRTTAMAAKFRCHCKSVDYYYDDGAEGTYQGALTLGKETTINTYEGHVFFFTAKGDKSNVIAKYKMDKDQSLYIIESEDDMPPESYLTLTAKEKAYHEEYLNKTGILWRHYFGPEGPRPPPILHMWPASHIGQVHEVVSTQGFWSCEGSAETCQSNDPVTMHMEVASLEPRAFLIPKFLSDYETDEIIRLAKPQIHDSKVGDSDGAGARKSDTRTSRNAWVGRKSNAVTETLYVRAAHLLKLDEKLLQQHTNAEDMQVVHYVNGQKYDSHHDWGVSGHPESRFITLLLYLTDMVDEEAGGETSFPKGADGLGFKVQPRKGSAVIFYNLLEDGNGDDLALHAALPVWRGEKWLANFWVWDPKRKS